jgi:hypothetical protein
LFLLFFAFFAALAPPPPPLSPAVDGDLFEGLPPVPLVPELEDCGCCSAIAIF